jgi:hypothetical protein
MMSDEIQDIADYRDAIEGLLLNGEYLEAAFPASVDATPNSVGPKAIALTSHRLIVCHRVLKRGDFDNWSFNSIPYSKIEGVELTRHERFHRDRIDSQSSVGVLLSPQINGNSIKVELVYTDSAMAREVRDRIMAYLLTVESRGLP